MQALKKAEQAKQKQNDLPMISDQVMPKQALSLDEQHAHVPLEVEGKQEKTEPLIQPTNESLTSPITSSSSIFVELSLTPQQEDASLEKELLALNEGKQSIAQQASLHQVTPQEKAIFNSEEVESIASPSASFTDEKSSAASNEQNDEKNDEQIDAMKKNFPRPHIDVEKKQLSEQTNANQLWEQKKAQAVFASKVPQSKLRSRWILVVVIAMISSLLGVAYIYWQQVNHVSNQFPVNASSPDQQLPLADNATPVSEVNSAVVSDGVSAEVNDGAVVKIDPNSSKSNEINKTLEKQLGKKNNTTKINAKINGNAIAIADARLPTDASLNTARKASLKNTNSANEIQISKGSSGAKINPFLNEAYQAYLAGDSQNATLKYQKVLQQEPNNRDALLGLAAIALNTRQAEQAGTYYGHLLTLDPNDPDAIAGLTSLQQGDPVQSESRLKSALNQNPNAGSILFALGNLYAQQSRWSDAQQTYFRAYTTTPNNADYAFNLAVSLDRLNQRKLAIDYYQRAVALGKSGNVNFNLVKAQQRLSELESIRDK